MMSKKKRNTHVILHPRNGHTNSVKQPHFSIRALNFLHQSHQVLENRWRVRFEYFRAEFEHIKYLLELPAGSNSDHQIIQLILTVEQMLKYLVYGVTLQFVGLDGHPLTKKNCYSSPKDIITGVLDLDFGNESVLKEIAKIELLL